MLAEVLIQLLFLFWVLMIARIAMLFILSYSREYRPAGVALVAIESVLTVTDPPVKAVRLVFPPLRIGNIRFDTATLVVFLLIQFAMLWVRAL